MNISKRELREEDCYRNVQDNYPFLIYLTTQRNTTHNPPQYLHVTHEADSATFIQLRARHR